jgi:death-on-curing protein
MSDSKSPLEPRWIRDDVVAAVHLRQLAEHGGLAGLRDEGLLASALERPRNLFAYGEPPPDISALAAAYAYGIARNHPFVDGNKRVSFVVCQAFLLINGLDIEASQEEKYNVWWRLAAGELSQDELAVWLRNHLVNA